MQPRPNRPHQNKRNDPLLRIVQTRWWQKARNIVANVLAQVSVPTENGSQ
jgi:hypothetical protein